METATVERTQLDATNLNVEKRNGIVLECLPMVRCIAARIAKRIPSHVEIDDLINAGSLGLIDAVDKFDSSRKIKFKTYAEFRIKGAILDELRAQDWMPRSVRQRASRLERAYAELEQQLGRPATDIEIAEFLNIPLAELHTLLNESRGVGLISSGELSRNLDDNGDRNLLEYVADSETFDLAELLYFDQVYHIVAQAIEQLPEKERIVISLYYYERLTMREVGEIMKVSESRVSQIHTRAIMRLRGRLMRVLKA